MQQCKAFNSNFTGFDDYFLKVHIAYKAAGQQFQVIMQW